MLTSKQQKVLRFLESFIQKYGFSPSYKDIAGHFNFSSDGTVRTYLEYLERAGYIVRHGKARAIKLVQGLSETPILGTIKAGNLNDFYHDMQGSVQSFNFLESSDSRFALRVSGDSMIDAGIMEGDVAVIDKQKSVVNGDIVAVSIEGAATLKFYKKNKQGVFLSPANKRYQPIHLRDVNASSIFGKCIGIVRFFS